MPTQQIVGPPPDTALAPRRSPTVIPPGEAPKHIGEWVTVEMQVRSTHVGKSGYAFLNSEANYKAPSNLAVVIPPAVLQELRDAGADPPRALLGATIRVEGNVKEDKEHKGAYEIWADNAGQVTVVRRP